MKKLIFIFFYWFILINHNNNNNKYVVAQQLTEPQMAAAIDLYNEEVIPFCNQNSLANWAYQTDITNQEAVDYYTTVAAEYAQFRYNRWNDIWREADPAAYIDEGIKRQLKFLKEIGTAALTENEFEELTTLTTQMQRVYNSARICPYEQQDCDLIEGPYLTLDPEMEKIMAESSDYDELLYVWQQWREKTGRQMPDDYERYVELMNMAAIGNGFDNAATWWQSRYEYENNEFENVVDRLWVEVQPLYNALHTYVRLRLIEIYGNKMDWTDENIPAHLLGNMWAQSWGNLYDRIKPYKSASLVDVTGKMEDIDYTVMDMFEESNKFFMSLGLENNNMSYDTTKAMIEKPTDGRTVNCHASAWDFCDGEDFRIKMCTSINMNDFQTVHHEMGHIQYYLQYADQPITLRGGANPGFHEAVGDTIALSVATPKHLQTIGLLDNYEDTQEDNINALFSMALDKVAFLPFGLLIDKWRWNLFNGNIERPQWNTEWWRLRELYQKVSAPIERSPLDFDPGAKFHVPANSQYIAYFIAHILEFQMYKALCIEAGEYNPDDANSEPLHKCDFYENQDAGSKLSDGLKLGTSEHWSVALEAITGESDISAEPLLEYFAPLLQFLEEQNIRLSAEHAIRTRLFEHDGKVQDECNKLQLADWAMTTNLDDESLADEYTAAVAAYATFARQEHELMRDLFENVGNSEPFSDESLQRQLKFLSILGTNILDEGTLNNLTTTSNNMINVYNKAVLCPYNNQECDLEQDIVLTLNPEITERMAVSQDYQELLYLWAGWHDSTGNLMREDYRKYVALVNEAADANEYDDYGAMLRDDYEDDNLIENMKGIWDDVKSLYKELHTYVRRKLHEIYPEMDENDELIPAHLLGNMWAQSWVNLYERIKPFPEGSDIDVTSVMQDMDMTPYEIFSRSDEFFMSLGLPTNFVSYNDPAIIEKPSDRTIVCHASAWDFCDGQDFRIKQCTTIDMESFITAHHEMGHIQYFILYKDQPQVFRGGANPGFHEAVGDLIALSVSTPQHLVKIGLLDDNYEDSEADNINALFKMALERVAFLPFGLLIDLYRYDVFSGNVDEENWNAHWEQLREEYQMIRSPVQRSEANFDPGAKFHVPSGYQYINYFVAHILEFQLHKSMCIAAGQYDPNDPERPLHKCDIHESKEAGQLLRDGLSLGMSKHWSEALQVMTGDTELKADALLEYFKPLYDFLRNENYADLNEAEMEAALDEYNVKSLEYCRNNSLANWDVQTNVNDAEKVAILQEVSSAYAEYRQEQWYNIWSLADIDSYENPSIQRKLAYLKDIGTAALSPNDFRQLSTLTTGMSAIYNSAKICPYTDQDCAEPNLSLDPDLEAIMAESTDYDELLYVWEKWRDNTGRLMKTDYAEYVGLMNTAAQANGFSDASKWWQSRYEYDNDEFENVVDNLWEQVKELYDELHAYVRYKLSEIYGFKMDPRNENIPAHLLGNMWAQSWGNLYDRIKPFNNASLVDVTSKMQENGYTVQQMFEDSNTFFTSLGLEDNSMSYDTTKAMIEKPTDGRTVNCHASAWDFCDGEDFRIKMCTSVNTNDYLTVHHEMGHIQYFIQYADQPLVFRGGANPGFHEAVGDTIALSVATPQHLQKIELLDDYQDTYEDNINALFSMALRRVAFLPFGLLIDKWRWNLFNGAVPEEEWNAEWWRLREQYQKVSAPIERSPIDFDPGAKYHVPANSQYIAYFIAHILEFQMYKALCIEAGEYNPDDVNTAPLHKCDFFENQAAGAKLSAGLKLGTSEHWSVALEAITGESDISAEPLLEYFAPLLQFLRDQNTRLSAEHAIRGRLFEHDGKVQDECNKLQLADWAMTTNLDDESLADEYVAAVAAYATFARQEHELMRDLFENVGNSEAFSDESLQRQLKFLSILGTNILDEETLNNLTTTSNNMINVYNKAVLCPYDNQDCDLEEDDVLTLDPEITERMAVSQDYQELLYLWEGWHDSTGNLMREDYRKYVALVNEAADANEYPDYGAMLRDDYEDDNLIENMKGIWDDVKSLYKELHTYVRRKLHEIYPEMDENDELIPAHLLGNMWAQSWVNLYEHIKPFPEGSDIDVTSVMQDMDMTPYEIFSRSDEFFMSLGLPTNFVSYNDPAIIEKPSDRTIVCHASAWDFCDGQDFRIKQCTTIDMESFITAHHEMGHIQYFILYKDQPQVFRGGANPGFHEAVGDLIALSVSTPQHLVKIGLLDDSYEDSEADNINALFKMALERVAFLPFGLLIDLYRYDVFSGNVDEENWNAHWEQLREEYQMIRSPVQRSEANFDPGAKFHVPSGYQYINYFVAHILEFQLHKSMCIAADQYDPNDPERPLHKCDIHESKEAGQLLRDGLSLGMSKHWSEALQVMTGDTELKADALLEYFKPLYDFLRNENYVQLDEEQMVVALEEYNSRSIEYCQRNSLANWDVQTNVNDADKVAIAQEISSAYAEYRQEQWYNIWSLADIDSYEDSSIQRKLTYLKDIGTAALSPNDFRQLSTLTTGMSAIYNSAKICPYTDQDCAEPNLSLDPDLEAIMAESTDYDELLYVWEKWRDNTGRLMKTDYAEYVGLMNTAAQANGFTDASKWWQSRYEYDNDEFENVIDNLWEQVKELYDELHAFVRYKLSEIYGYKMDPKNENIPAHLLGNMWAQSWSNLYDRIKPFNNASLVDVTSKMLEKGYTVQQMFEDSNTFFTSLNLEDNSMSYDPTKAMIEKPTDGRTVNCHASAWDFCDGEDFRIKMCTSINMNDYLTVHHEMGHIQYFIQYADQPLVFRGGANPGFHEAVGDTIALSVATPQHLQKIELLDNYQDTYEDNINALFSMALGRVAFLPFGLLIDKWRWNLFNGAVPEEDWNAEWWKLREQYQKVSAPTERSPIDFDPGAKYHVPANSQYIAYFIAHILEFQMYKALCIEAGEYNPDDPNTTPLHKCDFFENQAAGAKLSAGLKLGTSEHWSVALEAITGETDISAEPLLEYFAPLLQFLKEQNTQLFTEHAIRIRLFEHDEKVQDECNKLQLADWAMTTNLDDENLANEYVQAVTAYAAFARQEHALLTDLFNNDQLFSDQSLGRQLKFLSALGTNRLDDVSLERLTNTSNRMINVYNKAVLCKFEQQNCNLETDDVLTLDPEITSIMATSTNYDELLYIWHEWHDKTGNLMRDDYKEYVTLVNEAASQNGHADYGAMLRADYEDDHLIENMLHIWEIVEPLYRQLHTYVRRKLFELYPGKLDPNDELIPAHLLGNMWAQSWVNLYERIKPFPEGSDIDITPVMQDMGMTPYEIFSRSDEFFMSLGLPTNFVSYNEPSIIEKPLDRTIVCHASAWDFCDGQDFRIKQCTTIDMVDFVTAHHEMGHIQYYILYKDQPQVFRRGANPGFHEAVGDLIALSVQTPKHLEKIGLLENYADTEGDNINALFKMALQRVAFLPFGLLIDLYRYDIFRNNVTDANWNQHWETLRERYQKIKSPVERTETNFDAGAKFHVPSGYQYINYFIAHILEFQLHKSMCLVAEQYDPNDPAKPLHKCDIDNSKEAGDLLRAGLSLGSSRHWSEALQIMTGDTELKADALMEYFAPLLSYLERENERSIPYEPVDQLIPIVIGSVLGALLLASIAGFFIYRYRKNNATPGAV